MLKKIMVLLVPVIGIMSCAQKGADKKETPAVVKEVSSMDKPAENLKGLQFASQKDLSCGMPISAGVADTAHYKGKLYGFCAKECKEAFLKDPEQYLSAK